MKKNILIFLASWFVSYAQAQTYHIKTVAGNGTFGYSGDGGAATSAQLATVRGMATDDVGNLYFCDSWKNTVRKIDTNGVITTIAGTGVAGYSGNGGTATAAKLNYPKSITVDPAGNIYFTEINNHVVRKIDPAGIITLFAGSITYPTAITSDRNGNVFFNNGYSLYKWHAPGPYTYFASIPYSEGLTIDRTGYLRTLDFSNNRIRKISPTGVVSFWAGNGGFSSIGDGGAAINAEFAWLYGIAADTNGNIYTAEQGAHVIRKIGLNDTINAFAGHSDPVNYFHPGFSGDNGPAWAAEMNGPKAITVDLKGNVYFFDENNNRIRKIYFYNFTPEFTAGDTATSTICAGIGPQDIDALLTVSDRDTTDTLSWSLVTAPAHGTATGSYSAITNGGTITPSGFYYTPDVTYSGIDVFTVRVFDGKESDTVTISINVNPMPAGITGTLSVCVGNTTTLACATSGGTWVSGNIALTSVNATTGAVTGLAAGASPVSYISGQGCPRVTTVTVLPIPDPISGASVVCIGQNTILSNSVTGGTWSSSNTGVVLVGVFTGVLTGMSAGTANITYRLPTGCRRTTTVSATSIPGTISGATSVCVGSTTTLTHADPGGTWTSSNTAKATIDTNTGVVTGVSYGVLTITYRTGPGCYRTMAMTVNNLPSAISGTPVLCAGGSITLSSVPSGGAWSSSDTSVAAISAPGVVDGITAGNAIITYTSAAGCYRTITATVNAAIPTSTGNTEICFGGTSALANATTGGTWVSSATSVVAVNGTSGVVYGVSAGTANITYRVSAGCRVITVVSVHPAIAAITGAPAVCPAATTDMLNSTPGGTWSSSNPSLGSIDPSTGTLAGIAQGAFTITYTLPTGCFKTKAMAVYALPPAITGSTTICTGNTTALSGPTGTWTSSDTGIATVVSSTRTVTGLAAGTTTITAQNGNGCIRTATVTVLQSPEPVSGTLAVCIGSTTTLASVGSPGGTWTSSVPAKATIGSSTGTVTGIATGTSVITYTWTNGCKAKATATVNTIPSAATIGGAGVLSVTATQTLTTTLPGGTWTSSNVSRATVDPSSGLMTGISAGAVAISYSQTNSCGTRHSYRSFTITTAKPAGPMSNITGDALFSVYPNPASGAITIATEVTGVFTVYTVDGRVVSGNKITGPTTSVALPSGLAAGIYLCRFTGDDGSTQTTRLELRP